MANSSSLAFCLEYSNHKTDMMEAFDSYLRNESMVDVMLSCEGNTIKAHKMVLSAGSTYFRNIFSAFKNPFQFPVLIIKDMPFRDLKAIVEFLYRGEVVVPVEQVSSLSKSAQTLFIKGLEKYFNKSAMVNVAKHSTGATTGANTTNTGTTCASTNTNTNRSTPNPVNTCKSKNTNTQTKRSIGMSLRQKARHLGYYRQLSNGDFNSEESNSEAEHQSYQKPNHQPNQQLNPINKRSTQVTIGPRNQNNNQTRLSTPIKSEVGYSGQSYRSDLRGSADGGPPILEVQLSVESTSHQMTVNSEDEMSNEEDIHSDALYRSEYHSNPYSGLTYMEEEEEEAQEGYTGDTQSEASLSKPIINIRNEAQREGTVGTQPKGLIKNPIRITPRRVKTPFMGRHKKRKGTNRRSSAQNQSPMATTSVTNNSILGPIKSDPDKVEIIHCSLCPRVFSQTSSLNIHMKRIHAEEQKEHICQLCGKKYSWRSGLYKHMRTHRN